jgi:FkbM family methyltransferase
MFSVDLKGSTTLDIGAHMGVTSVPFALKEARKVYAFEPSHLYRKLTTNMALNGLENVIVTQRKAVGDRRKTDEESLERETCT